MKLKYAILALGMTLILPFASEAEENHIRSVIAADDLTIEVQMAQDLTKDELDPSAFGAAGHTPEFTFSDGLYATGVPIPERYDGFHDHVYKIPVNGLEVGPIYKVSYKGQKPLTFKAYPEKEMKDRYADRWGDYF